MLQLKKTSQAGFGKDYTNNDKVWSWHFDCRPCAFYKAFRCARRGSKKKLSQGRLFKISA